MRKFLFALSGALVSLSLVGFAYLQKPDINIHQSVEANNQDGRLGLYADIPTSVHFPKIDYLITKDVLNSYSLDLGKKNPFFWMHEKVEETEINDEMTEERQSVTRGNLLDLSIGQTPISPIKRGQYKVTSPFGVRVLKELFNHEPHLHRGIDLGCVEGTEVFAPLDGVVEEKFYSQGGGNVLIIKHGENVTTVYAHLKTFKVDVGDEVKQGDLIALSGNTGEYTTGPHLHFELWFDKVPLDPSLYIDF